MKNLDVVVRVSILRACGGSSQLAKDVQAANEYSPRMRR